MKPDSTIKNLVFDLGGVIVDLSIDSALQAFTRLSGFEKSKVDSLYATEQKFLDYEMGLISEEEFRAFVTSCYSLNCTDEELDKSWNSMIVGLPLIKLQLLERLKKTYNVFLLSNTNSIHIRYINSIVLPSVTDDGKILDDYFHRAYYSHMMNMRKPNADIFEEVLRDSNLKAHETLFLDDNAANIEGAQKVGIKTVHVVTPDLILDYFHES